MYISEQVNIMQKKNKLHQGNVVQNHEIDQLKMNHLKIFKEFEFWS